MDNAIKTPTNDKHADKHTDYNLEQLEAIWLEYQHIGQATCPFDGVRLEIELVNHPFEGESEVAEVYVKSPRGKSAIYRPSDSTVRAWIE
jgi:hypothetical protein